MDVSTVFNPLKYALMQKELETIQKIHPEDGDKLAVVSGNLQISKGGFLQAPLRTIQDFRLGGFNRQEVTKKLEEIASNSNKMVEEIKKEKEQNTDSLTSHYQAIKDLKSSLKKVRSIVSSMEFQYRSTWRTRSKTNEKLFDLYEQFSSQYEVLKKEILPNIQVPQDYTPPKKEIVFETPIRLVKHKMSKWQTPEDVLKLGEHAKKLEVPLWKKVYAVTLSVFILFISAIPLGFLNLFKWVIWNPVELIVRKEITTRSPTDWLIDEGTRYVSRNYFPDIKRVIPSYANQLLQCDVVTDNHIKAFSKMAQDVKEIDLRTKQIVSFDVDDLYLLAKNELFYSELPQEKEAKEAIQIILNKIGFPIHCTSLGILYQLWKDQIHWVMKDNCPLNPKKEAHLQTWASEFDETKMTRFEYLDQKLEISDRDTKFFMPLDPFSFKHFKEVIEIAEKNKNIKTIFLPFDTNSEITKLLDRCGFKKRKIDGRKEAFSRK